MAILGICVMCKKKVTGDMVKAEKIDGLWLCGSGCRDKFLKEKKKWTPTGWNKLCQYAMHLCSSTPNPPGK